MEQIENNDQREMDARRDQGSGAELGEEGEDARAPGEEHVDADHQQDGGRAPGELHPLECNRLVLPKLAT